MSKPMMKLVTPSDIGFLEVTDSALEVFKSAIPDKEHNIDLLFAHVVTNPEFGKGLLVFTEREHKRSQVMPKLIKTTIWDLR